MSGGLFRGVWFRHRPSCVDSESDGLSQSFSQSALPLDEPASWRAASRLHLVS